MKDRFVITAIDRVIMVGKDEYPERKISFFHDLKHHELIFHFSGQSTVFFNDLCLETPPNTIRFLPKGEVHRYDVVRKENGECIDVFFDTDLEISPKAFVINVSQNEKIAALFKKLFSFISMNILGSNCYFSRIGLLVWRMQKRHDMLLTLCC